MTPDELSTLCTELNGGATINATLLEQLVNQGRTILFSERDWSFLKKTDTSISVSASVDAWNTPVSIAGITDFLRFYQDDKGFSIKIFDGANRIEYYRQVPFSKRLEYKDVQNTFVYDQVNKTVYFNGSIPFSGTAYINYIMNPVQIDISLTTNMETVGSMPCPGVYHPILGYYAVGINKGAIDYDSINREMLPNNQATLNSLKNAMEKWDTNMQLAEQMQSDPSGNDVSGFQSNTVPIHNL